MIQLTFENATNLWFLLSIPLLVVAHYFFLRHAKRRGLLFANFRALKRVTGESLVTKNYFLLALRCATLLLVILSVSGITLWYEGRTDTNDYVIAVDTSSSMTSQDVLPTRLDAAKADANLFVDAVQGDTRFGVLSFAGVSLIETVPINDKAAIKAVISSLEPLKAGGTDIPGAIITSTNLLLDNSKGRSIILITDGSNTIETFLDSSMQRAIGYAKEHHVMIHTIGVGTNAGPVGYIPSYYNVSSVYNEDNLIQISNATGGMYSKATNAEELLVAFQKIVDTKDNQLLRFDLRAPLMLAGLLLIMAEWLLINTRFRRLP